MGWHPQTPGCPPAVPAPQAPPLPLHPKSSPAGSPRATATHHIGVLVQSCHPEKLAPTESVLLLNTPWNVRTWRFQKVSGVLGSVRRGGVPTHLSAD